MTTDAYERLLPDQESGPGAAHQYSRRNAHTHHTHTARSRSSSTSSSCSDSRVNNGNATVSPFSHSVDSMVVRESQQQTLKHLNRIKLAKWLSTIITSTANFSVQYNFSAVSIALVVMSVAECTSSAAGTFVRLYMNVCVCV